MKLTGATLKKFLADRSTDYGFITDEVVLVNDEYHGDFPHTSFIDDEDKITVISGRFIHFNGSTNTDLISVLSEWLRVDQIVVESNAVVDQQMALI